MIYFGRIYTLQMVTFTDRRGTKEEYVETIAVFDSKWEDMLQKAYPDMLPPNMLISDSPLADSPLDLMIDTMRDFIPDQTRKIILNAIIINDIPGNKTPTTRRT